MIGEILNYRYKVIGKISDEDFYSVYKCEDLIGMKTVAANVIHPQYATNGSFRDQILSDVEELKSIINPGIVRVLDVGNEENRCFVITDLVQGITLEEHMKTNAPYSTDIAIDTVAAICKVLESMHDRGFVHGDLRPANIIVEHGGFIKINNFWLGNAIASSPAIRTNNLMRSVHYMSPETANGERASTSSDIYSVGIILFQMLTGKLPFNGDSPISIAMKHTNEQVPFLRSFNPSFSRHLETILQKAMSKLPSARYRSAKYMMNDVISEKTAKHVEKNIPVPDIKEESSKIEVYEEDEYDPPALVIIRRVLIILVLVAIVAAAGVVTYIYTKPTDVIIPDFVGKTYSQAIETAAKSGLNISTKMEEYNEEFPAGTIYFNSPVSGRTTKRGNTVEIWLSKGSRYAIVPELNDLPLEDAQRKINETGLAIGEVNEEYSESVPMGNVIKQKPRPGTKVDRDTKVDLVYSLGSESTDETNSTIEENEQQSNDDGQPITQTRSFDVKFVVPPGEGVKNVEIAIVDDFGESIVYTQSAEEGDTVEQTVEAVGKKVKIRIYIDGKLAKEEIK